MKPLFRASNRQLLGSLITITNTRIYAPACGIFDPKIPDSYQIMHAAYAVALTVIIIKYFKTKVGSFLRVRLYDKKSHSHSRPFYEQLHSVFKGTVSPIISRASKSFCFHFIFYRKCISFEKNQSSVFHLSPAFALGLSEIRQKTRRCHKNVYDGLENVYYLFTEMRLKCMRIVVRGMRVVPFTKLK